MRNIKGLYAVILTCFDRDTKKPRLHLTEWLGSYKECLDFYKFRYLDDKPQRCRHIYKLEDISMAPHVRNAVMKSLKEKRHGRSDATT